ncbi:MAG TPA: S-formylglutathione hydrolase [Rudaea sp.]|jgi:S-formylglutathione hydrolase|nr:S-formylglutathione hydrolase [Rudaea sp.]
MAILETISEQRSFGGVQGFYKHVSSANDGPMKFAVYKPPQAERGAVPVLYYLAGLTCTEETFAIKAGAQRMASQLGVMLVTPDTSPRNTGIADEAADWEFGAGAGFYVDATEAPWSAHFKMYSYVTSELPRVIGENFPADMKRESIFGHSMGGHGALTIALKNPTRYKSVSAFAPIVAPSQVRWGQKALPRYLGVDQRKWADYDACQLVARGTFPGTILIDQGDADKFLADELRPQLFDAACRAAGQSLTLRMQPGYDHSYYFISTFMDDHLKHHAAALHA